MASLIKFFTIIKQNMLRERKLRQGALQCRRLVSEHKSYKMSISRCLRKWKTDPWFTSGSGSTPKFNHF